MVVIGTGNILLYIRDEGRNETMTTTTTLSGGLSSSRYKRSKSFSLHNQPYSGGCLVYIYSFWVNVCVCVCVWREKFLLHCSTNRCFVTMNSKILSFDVMIEKNWQNIVMSRGQRTIIFSWICLHMIISRKNNNLAFHLSAHSFNSRRA